MTIQDNLDEFRDDFPECTIVGLGDISSGLVLCSSSAQKFPQEKFDSLCEMAIEIFSQDTAGKAAKALDMPDATSLHQGIVLAKEETYLFLKSKSDPSDAMFSVCSSKIDLSSFTNGAVELMKTIATEA